jgi:hypothetical protein
VTELTTAWRLLRQWREDDLGMTHEPADDFDHPAVPDGPLRRHVLLRKRPDEWLQPLE